MNDSKMYIIFYYIKRNSSHFSTVTLLLDLFKYNIKISIIYIENVELLEVNKFKNAPKIKNTING